MLGEYIGQANLNSLIHCFLFYKQYPTFNRTPPLSICPTTDDAKNISIFHSATVTFCAPRNPSDIGGLYHETIWSTPRWQTSGIATHQRDCVVLNTTPEELGLRGLDIAQVYLFFSFEVGGEYHSCALIHHFCKSFDDPDPDNGMWIVKSDFDPDGYQIMSIIHDDSTVHAHQQHGKFLFFRLNQTYCDISQRKGKICIFHKLCPQLI